MKRSDDAARSDERIERVLAGLGSVEAGAEVERRVQAAVRERLAAGTARGLRWGLAPWVMGAVAAMVVVGMVSYRSVVAHRGSRRVAQQAVVGMPRALPLPAPRRTSGEAEGLRVVERRSVRARRQVAPVDGGAMRLVSYPAPPAPLTEQERLLLQVARTGGKEEIAMLDPVIREREIAREDAEFEKFIQHNQ